MIASVQTRTAQLAAWLRFGVRLKTRLPWLILAALVVSLAPCLRSPVAAAVPPAAPAETVAGSPLLAGLPEEGVHLYGQRPEADQLGVGYMIFELSQNRAVGALYMPHSSFDCFQGQLRGGELAMMITNSYTQETYPYAVALTSDEAIASVGEAAAPLQLEGFYELESPSENDLRMLETCKANLQDVTEL